MSGKYTLPTTYDNSTKGVYFSNRGFTLASFCPTAEGNFWFSVLVDANKSISFRAVKLEIGTVSTLENDIVPDYSIELAKCLTAVDKFDTYANQGQINVGTPNPNLLDNPWFTINQRGASSYSNNQNSVDRWHSGTNSQVEVSGTGVTLSQVDTSKSGVIFQVFEDVTDSLNGKVVTISLLDNSGNLYTLSGTVVHNTVWTPILLKKFNNTFTVQLTAQPITNGVYRYSFDITTSANKTISFKAVKLELGAISTLAYDTAPDYTTELLKCQRYFVRLSPDTTDQYGIIGQGLMNTTTRAWVPLNLPVKMRTKPSVTYNLDTDKIKIAGKGLSAASGKAVTSITINDRQPMQLLYFDCASQSNLAAGDAVQVWFVGTTGAYIDLSADL